MENLPQIVVDADSVNSFKNRLVEFAKGFFASVQGRNVSRVYANDGNTALADGYSVLNLRLGNTFTIKDFQIEPFVGVNNLTQSNYIANVQINAQSDRYFEPASLQYFFGGVKLRVK